MFLKRLRLQAAQQNWFGVVVDLVILILGVFLGIQVTNWNQGRLDRKEGAEYRQRVVADIQTNRVDFANRLHYYDAVRGFAESTLAALDKPVEKDPQAFLVNAYQATQITPRIGAPVRLRRSHIDGEIGSSWKRQATRANRQLLHGARDD